MKEGKITITVTADKIGLKSSGIDAADVINTLEVLVKYATKDLLDANMIENEECDAYALGRDTAIEMLGRHNIPLGTIPETLGKILSALGDDEQARSDVAAIMAGYTLCQEDILKQKKSKKKK